MEPCICCKIAPPVASAGWEPVASTGELESSEVGVVWTGKRVSES
jgi:hypothetical protein